MKLSRRNSRLWATILVCGCCVIPLSYASDENPTPSRQQLVSVLNLEGESSAAAVIQNNGVIEFQGNALVDSVTKEMVASGTLLPGSALAGPRDLTIGMKKASTPLALVEKDFQTADTVGLALDAIMADATKISRESTSSTLGNMPTTSNQLGSAVGTAETPGRPVSLLLSPEVSGTT